MDASLTSITFHERVYAVGDKFYLALPGSDPQVLVTTLTVLGFSLEGLRYVPYVFYQYDNGNPVKSPLLVFSDTYHPTREAALEHLAESVESEAEDHLENYTECVKLAAKVRAEIR